MLTKKQTELDSVKSKQANSSSDKTSERLQNTQLRQTVQKLTEKLMKLEKDDKRLGQYEDIKKKIEAQMRQEGEEVKEASSAEKHKDRAISDMRKFEGAEDDQASLIKNTMNDRDYVAATITAWNACPGVVKKQLDAQYTEIADLKSRLREADLKLATKKNDFAKTQ